MRQALISFLKDLLIGVILGFISFFLLLPLFLFI